MLGTYLHVWRGFDRFLFEANLSTQTAKAAVKTAIIFLSVENWAGKPVLDPQSLYLPRDISYFFPTSSLWKLLSQNPSVLFFKKKI